jgi:hypothetical protein
VGSLVEHSGIERRIRVLLLETTRHGWSFDATAYGQAQGELDRGASDISASPWVGTPPTVLSSPAAIRAYLAVEPAAIGYVPAADVDETCRTLLVLGR